MRSNSRARELHLQVQRAVGVAVTNGRLIVVSAHLRQLDLGLLGGLLQALQRHPVGRQVDRRGCS